MYYLVLKNDIYCIDFKELIFLILGQLRLAEEGKYVPQIRPRGTATLDPVVAKLGIDTSMEKPALLLKGENDHKKPERYAFPRIPSQPRKYQQYSQNHNTVNFIVLNMHEIFATEH